jgi:hypothetical protein
MRIISRRKSLCVYTRLIGDTCRCTVADEEMKTIYYSNIPCKNIYEGNLRTIMLTIEKLGTQLTIYIPSKYVCRSLGKSNRQHTSYKEGSTLLIPKILSHAAANIEYAYIDSKNSTMKAKVSREYAHNSTMFRSDRQLIMF